MPVFAKPVTFSTRLIPNFLWHMLAMGKVGYNSEYTEKFHSTIANRAYELLDQHRALLKFGEGEGGELAAFFTMFPAFLPLSTREDLAAYFAALDRALLTKSLDPLIGAFPRANWSDHLLSHDIKTYQFSSNSNQLAATARDLGEAYLNCVEAYQAEVWPIALSALQQRAGELTEHFCQRDYIAQWEDLLGMSFAAPLYDITLCYANKNGPDYNSLGYGGNLIYYDKPLEKTYQFISHEIGTHLMIDTFLKLSQEPGIDFRRLYAAYETLAMFFNRQLLAISELAYQIPQFDDKRHLKKYEQVYQPGKSPEEMIRSVLE